MLIERLSNNRTVMDKVGVQAYLVTHIGNEILDRSSDHPVFKVFAAMNSGIRESAVESLIRKLFISENGELFGEPTIAVRDLYYEFFKVRMTEVGGHYFFKPALPVV